MLFALVSIVCRYLFLFYIIYFLWQGIVYILVERGLRAGDVSSSVKKQRYTIVMLHMAAFAILLLKRFEVEGALHFQTLVMGGASLGFLLFGFISSGRVYRKACPILFNGMFFLLDIGFIMLQRLEPELALRQLMFAFAGYMVMLAIPLVFKIIPRFEKLEYLYLLFGLGFLVALFLMGSEEYGSTRWLAIGPVRFQPSEFVKVLFVLYFASALRKPVNLIHTLVLCGISVAFIGMLALQKDLGDALLLFMTFMVMLYVATGSEALFSLGMGAACVAVFAAYKALPHFATRVTVWQNPWADVPNAGYQIAQSLFAIATWGPLGSGLFRGQPHRIPAVERDFIFPAISEEFGGLFGLLLIGVYIMIFYRGVHIALRCKKPFYSLISVGFTGLLAFQTFIIIGGDMNMIPMTGITLPFTSYGGSSVFICIIMIGLLQWLYQDSKRLQEEELDGEVAYRNDRDQDLGADIADDRYLSS